MRCATPRRTIGGPLGLDAEDAAAAILAVADNQMANAARMVSIEKGHDPREFVLFAFGGAGPMHAAAIARELGIPRVLVPRFPGITSALGCRRRSTAPTASTTGATGRSSPRASSGPICLGVMQETTKQVIDHKGPLDEGDVIIVNDPYFGGTHLMDVRMVKPFYYRGQLRAYLSNTGHWSDTGGMVPGGGYGGWNGGDGVSNGTSTIGISKNQPVEVLEQHFPVPFEICELHEGTPGPAGGGAGSA